MTQLSTTAKNQVPDKLYKQFLLLSNEVKKEFRKKGVVIPTLTTRGLKLGRFIVVKKSTGFYAIEDQKGEILYDRINLQQTAVLIANDLDLGKFVKNEILNLDQRYGWAAFEEECHKRGSVVLKNKSYEQSDIRSIKAKISSQKKKIYRDQIQRQFRKLCNLI
jgi:hypothetical protein